MKPFAVKQIQFKKIEKLEFNEAYMKVMHWFFSYPAREVSLNDLTKLVSISKTTANKIVSQLQREGFLKVQLLGALWRISCDQKHIFNTTQKIPYNLGLIYASGIVESILSAGYNPRFIALYGSYRKGDDIETSDLDIALEIFDSDAVKIKQIRIIPQLGYRKNVKVNLLIFSRKNIDINLFSNIVNGIILYGFLEVKQ